jgi:hypothetical protein
MIAGRSYPFAPWRETARDMKRTGAIGRQSLICSTLIQFDVGT